MSHLDADDGTRSRDPHALVFETTPAGVVFQDSAGRVTLANPAAQRILGLSLDQLQGRAPVDPCWRASRENGDEVSSEDYPSLVVLRTGRPVRDVLMGVFDPAREEQRWIRINATPLFCDGDDEPAEVVSTLEDVTDLRRAERALAERDESLRLTFDQAPVGAALFSETAFERVNDALCATLGYTREELLELDFVQITHPDDIDVSIETARRLRDGEAEQIALDKRYLRKDGQVVWTRTVVRAVRDDAGRMVSQLAMIDDVTEQRRALEELSLSEERLRSVLDAAHEGIILQARDGTILTFNSAAAAVFGVDQMEMVGRSALGRDWSTIREDGTPWPPDEHPTMLAMRSGAPLFDVVMGVVRDGVTRWLSINARPIVPPGETEAVAAVVSFTDQTDHFEAQRALHESEERYRLLLQNANDAVYVHEVREGVVGRFIEVNEGACDMLGYSREEFLAMDVSAIDTPEQHERVPAIVEELLRTGRATFDAEHVTKDGRRIPVEISTSAFELQGRTVIFSVARDISKRRIVEAALREMTEMRDVAEEVARVASWRYDLRTGRAGWSPEMYRLFDLDVASFDGSLQPVLERVHEDDRHLVTDAIRLATETGELVSADLRILRRDGSVALVHVSSTLERDRDGRPLALVGFCQDVTDQRAAEQALRLAEERFRNLFEQSPIPVWEEDFSDVRAWFDEHPGVTDWQGYFAAHPEAVVECAARVRVLASNRAGLTELGAASLDQLEASLESYFTKDSLPVFADELVTLAGGGTRFSAEIAVVDPRDRRPLTLEIHLSVVPGHEQTLDRVLVSFLDVSERRRAEAEIERLNEELRRRVVSKTEQVDAATRELEALAYSIAHDVRAPLRTIDGFSAAVIEDEAGRLSPEGATALRRVRNAAQTLARLLDDLMSLSHVSRRELVRRDVDLSAIALEVGEETAADHPSRAVRLTVAPGLAADADPALVRLILRELLANAWKFTAPHPSARVDVGALDQDGERVFFVRDDGVGFDMRYAEHLFGVFQRMHPPGQFEGDGVGLATVQRLVRRHGGRAWADAAPEDGATVYFTLPPQRDDGAARAD